MRGYFYIRKEERAICPSRLDKVFCKKSHEGYPNRKAQEKDWRAHNKNKLDDICPNVNIIY